jgi:hypothetical protein
MMVTGTVRPQQEPNLHMLAYPAYTDFLVLLPDLLLPRGRPI